MTVLRRLDCLLQPTKGKVLAALSRWDGRLPDEELEVRLNETAGLPFHNRSPLDFVALRREPAETATRLREYLSGFSENIRAIISAFELDRAISALKESGVLHEVVSHYATIDLRLRRVSEREMVVVFDDLRRRLDDEVRTLDREFSTPPDIARLMVSLLFPDDDRRLSEPGPAPTLMDPACGAGGLLHEAQTFVRERRDGARLQTYGQEINPYAWAVAASRMLLGEVPAVGQVPSDRVRLGDSITEDRFAGMSFDYLVTHPPFGLNWRYGRDLIAREREESGWNGRFGAGLPRTSNGELLFVQHAIAKFVSNDPMEGKRGSRLATLLTRSSLSSSGHGGDSDIRRWLIENDWLEAVIALPAGVLHETGIGTFLWIVTNRKESRRAGRVQLIDARDCWTESDDADRPRGRARRHRYCSEEQVAEIIRLHQRFEEEAARTRIVPNDAFGQVRVVVERPLRLIYRMTGDRKFRFLNACPELLDDLQSLDEALGRERRPDWNEVRRRIDTVLADRGARWTKLQREIFRRTFTETDPAAAPVRADGGDSGYEPDPKLRSVEEAPLSEPVATWFEKRVRLRDPDAWSVRARDTARYRIRFEDFFGERTSPRGTDPQRPPGKAALRAGVTRTPGRQSPRCTGRVRRISGRGEAGRTAPSLGRNSACPRPRATRSGSSVPSRPTARGLFPAEAPRQVSRRLRPLGGRGAFPLDFGSGAESIERCGARTMLPAKPPFLPFATERRFGRHTHPAGGLRTSSPPAGPNRSPVVSPAP